MDSIKYQQIKNLRPDNICKKSYNGPCLESVIQKQTSKSKQKSVLFIGNPQWPSQSPDLDPIENELVN